MGKSKILNAGIDRLLEEVGRRTRCPSRYVVEQMLGIQSAAVTRARKAPDAIPLRWFVKIYDLTGMTIEEQRFIAGVQPTMARHWAAPPAKPFIPLQKKQS